MGSSDGTFGVADEANGEGIQRPPPKRLEISLDAVKTPFLHVQAALLVLLEIENDPELLVRFLRIYGGPIRYTILTLHPDTGPPSVDELKHCVGVDCDVDLVKLVEGWRKAG